MATVSLEKQIPGIGTPWLDDTSDHYRDVEIYKTATSHWRGKKCNKAQ